MGSSSDMDKHDGVANRDVNDSLISVAFERQQDSTGNDVGGHKTTQPLLVLPVVVVDNLDPANLRQWLQQHGSKKLVLLLDTFIHELRIHAATNTDVTENTMNGTRYKMVHKTLNLVRHMIGATSWKTPAEVLNMIRCIGSEIVRTTGTNQHDPAIENIIRRVMATIREEAIREDQDATAKAAHLDGVATTSSSGNNTNTGGDGGRLSLQSILWALPPPQNVGRGTNRQLSIGSAVAQRQESLVSEEEMKNTLQATSSTSTYSYTFPASYYTVRSNFKATVLEAVQEILSDFEDMHRNINEQVLNYIHAGEIILTCGNSDTVEVFLKAAYTKIRQQQQPSSNAPPPFTVIVCGDGYQMACNLSKAGIATNYIENAAVFAIMARVNKVLLPAHAVLANGGLVTQSGCSLVALAANAKSVPVVCISGLYKLCPMFPHEGQDTLQELLCPVPTLVPNYSELHTLFDDVELMNPLRDYIEPKLITLYITNVGSFPPSFIYRLLAENYHIDDWKSFL